MTLASIGIIFSGITITGRLMMHIAHWKARHLINNITHIDNISNSSNISKIPNNTSMISFNNVSNSSIISLLEKNDSITNIEKQLVIPIPKYNVKWQTIRGRYILLDSNFQCDILRASQNIKIMNDTIIRRQSIHNLNSKRKIKLCDEFKNIYSIKSTESIEYLDKIFNFNNIYRCDVYSMDNNLYMIGNSFDDNIFIYHTIGNNPIYLADNEYNKLIINGLRIQYLGIAGICICVIISQI